MTEGERERIKLRATFFNGVGIGFWLVGTLAPITSAIYNRQATRDAFFLMAATAVICFAVGLILHFYAASHLEELDR
ncbi:hypothetical protein [Jiella marina]|uniref:hypothetical protein n=1 Tax=Jiella sp. LLJ827 TaxID=2917712 RepID=UPI002101247D|nr:hypothetical protein [Jiella sp. LLJ827]MCQ0989182.1 hypothetical protein [Jiella sp. LLJ827]